MTLCNEVRTKRVVGWGAELYITHWFILNLNDKDNRFGSGDIITSTLQPVPTNSKIRAFWSTMPHYLCLLPMLFASHSIPASTPSPDRALLGLGNITTQKKQLLRMHPSGLW